MSTWRKAMTYLGLGPEDEYDDYAAGPDDRSGAGAAEQPAPPRSPSRPTGTVRPRPAAGSGTSVPLEGSGDVRPLPPPPASAQTPTQAGVVREDPSKPRVRAVPRRQSSTPVLVAPTSFNSAQEVADAFKTGRAVAMDLSDVDRELARRLIDFSAGLCYGLGGNMEKVVGSVYLVVPSTVEVTAEDRARLARRSDDF